MKLLNTFRGFGRADRKNLRIESKLLYWEILWLWNNYGRKPFNYDDVRLMDRTGLTRMRLRRARKELIDGGYIQVELGKRNRKTSYVLCQVF